jgi:hypothetical protein
LIRPLAFDELFDTRRHNQNRAACLAGHLSLRRSSVLVTQVKVCKQLVQQLKI